MRFPPQTIAFSKAALIYFYFARAIRHELVVSMALIQTSLCSNAFLERSLMLSLRKQTNVVALSLQRATDISTSPRTSRAVDQTERND